MIFKATGTVPVRHWGRMMKQMFLGALIAATFLTPAVHAAETPYTKGQAAAASVGSGDVAEYRRGGGDHRGGNDGGRRGGQSQGQTQSQGQNGGSWQPSQRGNDDRSGGDRGWRQGNRSNDNGGNWQNQPQPQPRVAQPRSADPRPDEPRNDGRRRGQADGGNNNSGYGRVERGNSDRDTNRGWRTGNGERSDDRGYSRDDRRDRRNDRDGWDNRRDNDRDGNWSRRDDNRRWDNGWRNDQRYNWRNHRERNRNHYRIGRYYSPDRYDRYRRFSIGFYIGHSYYDNQYWINDPWSYRLPDVYGPYRWVRYYDDVLLIDLRNGYVVDTIYDFFW